MKYSKVQPTWHFIILSLATANLYHLYWFYKTWTFFKDKEKLSIRPSLRALFSIIFIWSLCKRINGLLKKEHITYGISTIAVGLGWILISAFSNLPDPWWLFYSLAFLPLLPMVKAMNLYWAKQEKQPLSTRPFKAWEGVLINLGLIFLTLAIVGVMLDTFVPGYLDS